MNPQLKEINEILALCDSMIVDIQKNGIISRGNSNYEEYKARIKTFLATHNLMRPDYGLYAVLDALYFTPNERTVRFAVGNNSNNYTLNMSEALTIRNAVIALKHEHFPDTYERIFISHREKDAAQVSAFIELLYAIGISRPTVGNDEKVIFCTSHPATYLENGARNLDEIREKFNCSDHTFFIMWYTDMSISEAFQTKGIPYYRGQDIYNTFIEEASPFCIDEDTYLHPHMIRSHLKSGDVLMSIVGAIVGNSAIVSSSNAATCSCKLSIIRSKNTGVLPEFLLIYIKTKYGQNQIQKFKRGAAQTGFLLEDFDQIFLPQLSMSFQEEIKRIVELSHFAIHQGDRVYNHAEQVFLSECEYQLPEREQITASVKTLSNSFLVSGRLDAE